jgi:hypothetical protein
MTNKNKVKAEVGEMKEVKELVRPVVDVEEAQTAER